MTMLEIRDESATKTTKNVIKSDTKMSEKATQKYRKKQHRNVGKIDEKTTKMLEIRDESAKKRQKRYKNLHKNDGKIERPNFGSKRRKREKNVIKSDTKMSKKLTTKNVGKIDEKNYQNVGNKRRKREKNDKNVIKSDTKMTEN